MVTIPVGELSYSVCHYIQFKTSRLQGEGHCISRIALRVTQGQSQNAKVTMYHTCRGALIHRSSAMKQQASHGAYNFT